MYTECTSEHGKRPDCEVPPFLLVASSSQAPVSLHCKTGEMAVKMESLGAVREAAPYTGLLPVSVDRSVRLA